MAEGLAGWLSHPGLVVAVEPEQAACLAPALAAGRPVRVPGDLHTEAEMLSCGEASAPALAVLRRHGAQVATVTEAELRRAPQVLAEVGGPATTPSGAAGLAGALAALADPAQAAELRLDRDSCLLILVTEGALPEDESGNAR
ncbi:pyridoxal-phosphate dependent enzyme, partial [Methylobacterium sp. EM32]|uniref:pyridoxal-phosphate dependent enzyme n=1 Tax=Methylobacterium sp. EM32 TaxID=3163481 RepID=UPI0033A31A68